MKKKSKVVISGIILVSIIFFLFILVEPKVIGEKLGFDAKGIVDRILKKEPSARQIYEEELLKAKNNPKFHFTKNEYLGGYYWITRVAPKGKYFLKGDDGEPYNFYKYEIEFEGSLMDIGFIADIAEVNSPVYLVLDDKQVFELKLNWSSVSYPPNENSFYINRVDTDNVDKLIRKILDSKKMTLRFKDGNNHLKKIEYDVEGLQLEGIYPEDKSFIF
ncbi:hypothetical protein [Acinetobacter sp. Ac_5812]|uniref:hypothetical protein n=1 Tax=Acinetobacter sp. Ac_5812 TaxID=1848937 RepID=UPI00148F607F|nr:hypothetical protein [Acinetobacter sp. Ac_5812]